MSSIVKQAHPWLENLVAYDPGKPIEETARELGLDPKDIIKVASNENPLGPSPKAIEAMKEAAHPLLAGCRACRFPVNVAHGERHIAHVPHQDIRPLVQTQE